MNMNWIQLILGFWILISPWLLGFSSVTIMTWSNLIIGMAMILLNGWIIFDEREKLLAADREKTADK